MQRHSAASGEVGDISTRGGHFGRPQPGFRVAEVSEGSGLHPCSRTVAGRKLGTGICIEELAQRLIGVAADDIEVCHAQVDDAMNETPQHLIGFDHACGQVRHGTIPFAYRSSDAVDRAF
jgi:hypothetical protein